MIEYQMQKDINHRIKTVCGQLLKANKMIAGGCESKDIYHLLRVAEGGVKKIISGDLKDAVEQEIYLLLNEHRDHPFISNPETLKRLNSIRHTYHGLATAELVKIIAEIHHLFQI